jgi:hypothetical protein
VKGKPNRAERIIAFLESRYPGWVPAIELEPVGGRQAWRTAVSEARAIVKAHGDDIENRTRMQEIPGRGARWVLSEYRLKKRSETPATRDAETHDLNQWELR